MSTINCILILMFLATIAGYCESSDYVLPSYTISTFGGYNSSKDGVSISMTVIGQPYDLRSYGSEIFFLEVDSVLGDRVRRFSNSTSSSLFESPVTTLAGIYWPSVLLDSDDGVISNLNLLQNPSSIAFDSKRNIMYIAQENSYRIRQVDLSTGIISSLVGNRILQDPGNYALVSPTTSIGAPQCLTYSSFDDSLYFYDNSFYVVRKIDLARQNMTIVAGVTGSPGYNGDEGLATEVQINSIAALAVDPTNGELYIATSSQIRQVNSTGYIVPFAGYGGLASYGFPFLTFGLSDIQALLFRETLSVKELVVASRHQIRVLNFLDRNIYFLGGSESNGETTSCVDDDPSTGTIGNLVGISSVFLNGQEHLVFAERDCKVIRALKFTSYSQPLSLITLSHVQKYDVDATSFTFRSPVGLALPHPYSNLYVSDSSTNKIESVRLSDGFISHLAGTGIQGVEDGPFSTARFTTPAFMSVMSDDEILLVSNLKLSKLALAGQSVYDIPVSGLIVTLAAQYVEFNSQLFYFVSDSGCIKRYNITDGLTELYGGQTKGGYSGDTGPAASAEFNRVSDIKFDSNNGVLYISDSYNHVIRMINLTDSYVTNIAGTNVNGYSGDGEQLLPL